MVFEKKHESCKDLGNNKETNNVKSSTSTEPAATFIMERTDTEDSDVDIVNINKFGAKKTSRWHRSKIDVSLKDLEKSANMSKQENIQVTKRENPKSGEFFFIID